MPKLSVRATNATAHLVVHGMSCSLGDRKLGRLSVVGEAAGGSTAEHLHLRHPPRVCTQWSESFAHLGINPALQREWMDALWWELTKGVVSTRNHTENVTRIFYLWKASHQDKMGWTCSLHCQDFPSPLCFPTFLCTGDGYRGIGIHGNR